MTQKPISIDMEAFAQSSPEAKQAVDKFNAIERELFERNERELGPSVKKAQKAGLMRVSGIGIGAVVAGAAAAYFSAGLSLVPQIAIAAGGAIVGGIAGEAITGKQAHLAVQEAVQQEKQIQSRIENLVKERDLAMENVTTLVAAYAHPEHKDQVQVYADPKNYIGKAASHVDSLKSKDVPADFVRVR